MYHHNLSYRNSYSYIHIYNKNSIKKSSQNNNKLIGVNLTG